MDSFLSIIIPTYKRIHSLERTVQSVIKYQVPNSEIIIVDQSPDNKTHSMKFKKLYPSLHYICFNIPGLPQARNIGINNSCGSVVLFLDDDVVIHPRCFYEHLSMYKNKNIDAIAGRIVQMNKKHPWKQSQRVTAIDKNTGETMSNFDLKHEENVLYATGGHMSINRSVFQSVGFFNTNFIGNALYEDVDFFFRMRKKGYTITYNPKAIVYHFPQDSGGCHEKIGSPYQLERLYNQTLFYFYHLKDSPTLTYLKYTKNIIEYISRKNDNSHSIYQFTCAIVLFTKAYIIARIVPLLKQMIKRK